MDFDEMTEGESEVIELKDNVLPTGLTPLEDIFDSNDIPRKPKMQPLNAEIEDCNIGTTENPKTVKLSKMSLHGAMRTSNPMTLRLSNIQYP